MELTDMNRAVEMFGSDEWAKGKNYCVLIWLKNPRIIEPFGINKSGFGSAAAWLCVEDINKIRLKLFPLQLLLVFFINKGNSKPTLKIAEMLLHDKEDLIHKAVGWMLREVGKRCSQKVLTDFLDKHYRSMPRTALRYSIERFPEPLRVKYLKGEI